MAKKALITGITGQDGRLTGSTLPYSSAEPTMSVFACGACSTIGEKKCVVNY